MPSAAPEAKDDGDHVNGIPLPLNPDQLPNPIQPHHAKDQVPPEAVRHRQSESPSRSYASWSVTHVGRHDQTENSSCPPSLLLCRLWPPPLKVFGRLSLRGGQVEATRCSFPALLPPPSIAPPPGCTAPPLRPLSFSPPQIFRIHLQGSSQTLQRVWGASLEQNLICIRGSESYRLLSECCVNVRRQISGRSAAWS